MGEAKSIAIDHYLNSSPIWGSEYDVVSRRTWGDKVSCHPFFCAYFYSFT
ncbi:hypothetical protein MTBPR1_80058 [Candidatus Terasakiella magnetica]|uniref:Uncharacterized protein n=1 Tax=Candidatus Terasakiella magnetica TaxID=1867952 RepID=A0A1C3RL45_9PROT|nr:hypothetical protein MTBPR1_80058 [Candidatus Terasakiella magnetica]